MAITDEVYNLCRSPDTVSSLLARDPSQTPGNAAEHLYGTHIIKIGSSKAPHHRESPSPDDLSRAYQCGRFGSTRPSELFLRIFHDALCTLKHDPLLGCVSPPLIGSCGVIPLSIVSSLPDIVRHMSNCIVRAEKEVFLATNYWAASDASKLITDALREFSIRCGQRGVRGVVKVMYDRGSMKQMYDNHALVTPKEWTAAAVQLPDPKDIPNLDMQVVNFHRPMLGTFHSKFMVVDRKIAIVQSNNIQDNDNLEMMTHLEGPIVDSFYDLALISWHKALEPPLPSLNTPAAASSPPSFSQESFRGLLDEHGELQPPSKALSESVVHRLPEHVGGDPHYDPNIATEVARMQSVFAPLEGETQMSVITRHLNKATRQNHEGTAPECPLEEQMQPYIPHPIHELFPIALVNRKPYGSPDHGCVYTPQNEAWLSAVRNAQRSVFIQTPDLNAEPLIPQLVSAVKRGIEVTCYVCLGYNDAGEMLPGQGGINEVVANKMYMQLEPAERKNLKYFYYVGKDQTRPVHNKFKARSCHIKIMIVDEHIGIQGNGNQDTQSWFHSQEVNILIDSPQICRAWLRALHTNQNTHIYGAASQEDGIWRDENGDMAEAALGKEGGGRFGFAKGIMGAINRVQGKGGF